jgi:hypothetical protein
MVGLNRSSWLSLPMRIDGKLGFVRLYLLVFDKRFLGYKLSSK